MILQESITGTVRNVGNKKTCKLRLELQFNKKRYEDFFQEYGYTVKKGYPITIIIKGQKYSIGFHKTVGCVYMWLSSRQNRDGYQLTDILNTCNFSKNEEITLKRLDKDIYELKKI